MPDFSMLDRKYFIDKYVYNCPFCNRNNIMYRVFRVFYFDWNDKKKCYGFLATCIGCEKVSMHLSYNEVFESSGNSYSLCEGIDDIDLNVFYSVPTSFFVLDERIPRIIRELISEAEGCMKMNFLTEASASMRKAIYELLVFEKIQGDSYDERIKALKQKYSSTDSTYFDILGHIKDMTSDKVHEQSWDKWDSRFLLVIIETLKSVLEEIYVIPQVKNERVNVVQKLLEKISGNKKEQSG